MNSFRTCIAKSRPHNIVAARAYATSPVLFHPTALHRAEKAADLRTHPESGVSQEKVPDSKNNRHWTEENATLSEADIRADHEAREEESAQKSQQKKPQEEEKPAQ